MVPNKRLKILNFEEAKPESDYIDLLRRVEALSSQMAQNTPRERGYWIVTGQRIAEQLDELMSENQRLSDRLDSLGGSYGPGLDNYGRNPLIGVDTVDNDPEMVNLRALVQPHRITPTGEIEEEE